MSSIIIYVESEVELQRVEESLNAKNIPYLVKRYEDSSFPSVSQVKPFAEISVDAEYQSIAREISISILNRTPKYKEEVKPKSKSNVWFMALIIYSVLISVIAFRYWYIHKKSSTDKNFNLEWSYDGTWLHLVNRETGKDGGLYIDKNLNYSFEEILTYSDSGFMVTKSIDKNENGRYEQFLNYNHNGDLVIRMTDIDDDGVIDEMEIALQSGKALKLVDKNKDGIFELDKENPQ